MLQVFQRNHQYGIEIRMQVWECPSCGVVYGIPESFADDRRRKGERYYCPNGHSLGWNESDTDRLKQARARESHLADQLRAAENEAEVTRRRLIRERHRFANGVCPCCNRSFTNVARHMSTQHPDYDSSHLGAATYSCSCSREFATPHGLRMHQVKSTWGTHRTVIG